MKIEPLACSNQPLTCSDLTDKFDKWDSNPITIQHIDPEEDWELGAQVEDIANKTGIRFGRNKDTRIVATDKDGNVVGGVADCFYPMREAYGDSDDEEHGDVYDFDTVVVHPKHQKASLVGLQLIHEAIKKAQKENAYGHPVHMIRTYCVNPRLAQVMVDHFGFEPESPIIQHDYEEGFDTQRGTPVHLVKYI